MRLMLFSALLIIPVLIFSQNEKRTAAWDAYKSGNLDLAKQLIEETCFQSETKDHPKTWYFKGLIYLEIEKKKTQPLDYRPAEIALQAILKSKSLDENSLFVNENLNELLTLGTIFLNSGSAYYNDAMQKDDPVIFKKSLSEFDDFFTVMKNLGNDSVQITNLLEDHKMPYTDILVFAGYAAYKSKNINKSKYYYSRLISYPQEKLDYDKASVPYAFITYCKILGEENNHAEAVEVIDKAIRIWPDNKNLAVSELKIYQDAGKIENLVEKYEKAVVNDPKNANLMAALAAKYDMIFSGYFKNGDNTNAEKFRNEAIETYKRAINLNPEDKKLLFDLNYNLGVLYYNPAVELYNTSLDFKGAEVRKPYKDKYDPMFNNAILAFEQAYKLNSIDKQLIDMMTRVYLILENVDKALEMKEIYKSLE
ncbi:MAG: hypothetical protein ABIJ97_10465 [Bacteroidota bacterium]